jgi:hypothetical protein
VAHVPIAIGTGFAKTHAIPDTTSRCDRLPSINQTAGPLVVTPVTASEFELTIINFFDYPIVTMKKNIHS